MSKMMKRGIFRFLLLLAVSIGIIYYTIDLDALKTISSFNSISLLLALIALAVGMYFDGLRLQRLVKIGGYKLSIKAVLRVIFSNYFMAMLTPGASGGAVAQVLVLKSYGVPISKGTPIVLIRTVFSIMFLVIMLPLVFLHDAIEIPYISRDMLLTFAVVSVIAMLVGTYILQTKYMRQFVYNLAQRFKAHKTKDWLSKLETLNQGLGLLYKQPIQSFIVFIESGLSLLCLYCIAPALMYAFTPDIPIIDILDRMILLNLILYFAPTPGGTGIAEGLFVVLFSTFVPNGTVGIVAVAWRVMAEYLPFFVGMYAVLTLYGRQFVAQETSTEQLGCVCSMTNPKKDKFYLVQEDILPEAIKKTIKVKEILKLGEVKTINEAVEKMDLSRSAYYKYKDYVFPFFEIAQGKIVSIYVSMSNESGMLSSVLKAIAERNGSILTINQDIPLQGIANSSISFETKDLQGSLEDLLLDIRSMKGIIKVEILGQA